MNTISKPVESPQISKSRFKKPITIYFIAFWLYFQNQFYLIVPIKMIMKYAGHEPKLPNDILGLIAIPVILIIILFIIMKPIGRMMAMCLFAFASYMLLRIMIGSLMTNGIPLPPRGYITLSLMLILNLICIYYLMKPHISKLFHVNDR